MIDVIIKGAKQGDSGYQISIDAKDIIGCGSNSTVFAARQVDDQKKQIGTDQYVGKVLDSKDEERRKVFVDNYTLLKKLKMEGDYHLVLQTEAIGKVKMNAKGIEQECCIMKRMSMDCASYIDRLNWINECSEDDFPFGNPETFKDAETIATAYGIILNVLKALEYLHSQDVYKIDLHPYNILISGKFDQNGFLLEPESLEVKVADIWPEKKGQTAMGTAFKSIDENEYIKARKNPERRRQQNSGMYFTSPGTLYAQVNPGKRMPTKPETVKSYSEACDIYSLGRMAIELLTGLLPMEQNQKFRTAPEFREAVGINGEVADAIFSLLSGVGKEDSKIPFAKTLYETLESAINSSVHYKVRRNSNGNGYVYVEMPYHIARERIEERNKVKSGERMPSLKELVDELDHLKDISPEDNHRARIKKLLKEYIPTYAAWIAQENSLIDKELAGIDETYKSKFSELDEEEKGLTSKIGSLQTQIDELSRQIKDANKWKDEIRIKVGDLNKKKRTEQKGKEDEKERLNDEKEYAANEAKKV